MLPAFVLPGNRTRDLDVSYRNNFCDVKWRRFQTSYWGWSFITLSVMLENKIKWLWNYAAFSFEVSDFWTPLCVKYIYKALIYIQLPNKQFLTLCTCFSHTEEGNNRFLLEWLNWPLPYLQAEQFPPEAESIVPIPEEDFEISPNQRRKRSLPETGSERKAW